MLKSQTVWILPQPRQGFRQLQKGKGKQNIQSFFDIVNAKRKVQALANAQRRFEPGRFVHQPVAMARQTGQCVHGSQRVSAFNARAITQKVECRDEGDQQQEDLRRRTSSSFLDSLGASYMTSTRSEAACNAQRQISTESWTAPNSRFPRASCRGSDTIGL